MFKQIKNWFLWLIDIQRFRDNNTNYHNNQPSKLNNNLNKLTYKNAFLPFS